MRNALKKAVWTLLALNAVGAVLQGCSVGQALRGSAPVPVDRVKAGERREVIHSTLGTPTSTEAKGETRTEVYEFADGNSNGSKARIILYLAGDVLTLGLAELIFWPVELAAGDRAKGHAVVDYGSDDVARSVRLTRTNGSPWHEQGQ